MATDEQVNKYIFQSENLESFKGRHTREQGSTTESTEWGGGAGFYLPSLPPALLHFFDLMGFVLVFQRRWGAIPPSLGFLTAAG